MREKYNMVFDSIGDTTPVNYCWIGGRLVTPSVFITEKVYSVMQMKVKIDRLKPTHRIKKHLL